MKNFIILLLSLTLNYSFAQTIITQNVDIDLISENPNAGCIHSDPENPNFVFTPHCIISRNFDLKSFGIDSDFTITDIGFGAIFFNFTGIYEFTVTLSTTNAPYPHSSLNELTKFNVFFQPNEGSTLKNFKLTTPVIVPKGSNLVMSYEKVKEDAQRFWAPLYNSEGQKSESYISAPECDWHSTTSFTSIGQPNVHVLMTVTGHSETIGNFELNSKSLSLFPNPAGNTIRVKLHNSQPQSVEILNLSGKSIFSVMESNVVNTSSLEAGVYLAKVKGNDGTTYINKFIKS